MTLQQNETVTDKTVKQYYYTITMSLKQCHAMMTLQQLVMFEIIV